VPFRELHPAADHGIGVELAAKSQKNAPDHQQLPFPMAAAQWPLKRSSSP
jgi:hypothetical protein